MSVVVHPNYFSLVKGNEDCVPNYKFNAVNNASAHPALPHLVSGFVETGIMSLEQMQSFSQCGFYGTNPTGTNLKVLGDKHGNLQCGAKGISKHRWRSLWAVCVDGGATERRDADEPRVMILGHIIPQATKWNSTYLDLMKSYTSIITSRGSATRTCSPSWPSLTTSLHRCLMSLESHLEMGTCQLT
ncbi:Hypothetical protein, putative [Bodo saltans]|uniref:Uncharacterized protein n=1 Tax=Bodo saltans TaxID=75058 RepID=A0A0S4JHP5_BODSA|nr:Hypothetical protein, putative [Bodo saltans]|eukprot:CUG90983.1 Hypothetical protein, putative [Bodo saltans]